MCLGKNAGTAQRARHRVWGIGVFRDKYAGDEGKVSVQALLIGLKKWMRRPKNISLPLYLVRF